MSDQLLRFLHAGDFQLDQPLHGVTEIPESLRSVMIDAPYAAAEQVMETAIVEKVALVVLTGNLVDLAAPTARSLSFLREQFRRLAEHRIPVYWSETSGDTVAHWPQPIELPESVHRFCSPVVEKRSHDLGTQRAVTILGRGGSHGGEFRGADFHADAAEFFSIAAVAGHADPTSLATRGIDYWALGGRHDRKTLFTEPHVAHSAGTPQGRHPQDLGPHGCTLVEVRQPREVRLRFVPCDVVRWLHERVMVSAGSQWDDLSDLLAERVQEARSQCPSRPLLVRWTLVAADATVEAGRLQQTADRAAKWLRKEYGEQADPCWPVSVEVEVPEQISAVSYEEDSLLGDYLRSIRQLREDSVKPVFDSVMGARGTDPAASWVADLSDSATREQVLREAAELGAALLRGEDVPQIVR